MTSKLTQTAWLTDVARRWWCIAAVVALAVGASAAVPRPGTRPNILFILADDLSYHSLDILGGIAPNATPHVDALARGGLLFTNAHVADSVCQPSRQSMFSGVYPHRYGSVGFWPMQEGTMTAAKRLREAGYVTGGFAKLQHMQPADCFDYEIIDKDLKLGVPLRTLGRNPTLLAKCLSTVISTAHDRGAPFLAVIDAEDPHRPFHGDPSEAGYFGRGLKDVPAPSRVYRPDEVTVPPFLPDLPRVRVDLARYASSVRRLDDVVGACLKVLHDSGAEQNTLVIFLSDNGMSFPFGKFDTYVEGTHTPLIMRWPGVVPEGTVDNDHLVSMVDLAPTLIELGRAKPIADIDGRSLCPLLFGEPLTTPWRDYLVTVRYEEIYYGEGVRNRERKQPGFTAQLRAEGWVPRPEHEEPGTYSKTMNKRAVIDRSYVYIFNDWYDGTPKLAFPYGDPSYFAMAAAAKTDPKLAARVEFFRYRTKEELYRYEADPGYYQNLSGDADEAAHLREARQRLAAWMAKEKDPIAGKFAAYLKSLPDAPTKAPAAH